LSASGFEAVGGGRYRVTGNLGFDTVPALWTQSLSELNDSAETVIDLGQVTHVDSAGLALVIEWVHWAHSHGRRLRLVEIPEKLVALARISETDSFLDPNAAAPESRLREP
jgi:phospholipid transport system transporter-binding protein